MYSAVFPDVGSCLARPAYDLDRLFAPRPTGYAGADVGMSIPLGDGRTLWVFGDTLVGSSDSTSRTWHAMPHNTVAIQPTPAVEPEAIEWHFADSTGQPSPFFRLPNDAGGEWFWPGTGCVIRGELFILGYGVVAADNECEALAFRITRGWLFRVSDFSADPSRWKYVAAPLTWNTQGSFFFTANFEEDEYSYLLGTAGSKSHAHGKRPAVLARVLTADLLTNGADCAPQFWTQNDGGGEWCELAERGLQSLYVPGVSEASIYYDRPRGRYIATTYTGSQPEFLLATAPALTGPWSQPSAVYGCAEGRPIESHLFYAFRMHPQLASGPKEMVLSYVINARDPAELKNDLTIYYPRFVRLDLREI